MQSLVIFDCDGVLVDSERISHAVLVQMLAEHGVEIGFEQAVQRFIGTSIAVCMDRVAELLGGPLPPGFRDTLELRTRQAFEDGLSVVPGVEAVIDSLPGPYCVASNGNHAKVSFTLGHTGLLSRFEGRIFTADDVANPKPAPDLFLHAAQVMGVVPRHTTVVEDTPTGVTAAKAAGMRVIGFTAMTPSDRLQAAGADALAASMPEVGRLLVARSTR